MAPSATALFWLLRLFLGNSEASPLPPGPGAGNITQRCQITAGETCPVRLENLKYYDIFKDRNLISEGYCSNGVLSTKMPGVSEDSEKPPGPEGCYLIFSEEAAGTYTFQDTSGTDVWIVIVEVQTFFPDRPVINGTSNSTDRAVQTFFPDRPVINGTSNSTDRAAQASATVVAEQIATSPIPPAAGGLERAHPHWGSIAAVFFVLVVISLFIVCKISFHADCLRRDRDPPGGAPDNIPMEQQGLPNGYASVNHVPTKEDEEILHRSSDAKTDNLLQCSKDTNYSKELEPYVVYKTRAECNLHLVVVYPNSHALNKSAVVTLSVEPTLPPANMSRAWKGRSLDTRHKTVLTGISCAMTAFRYWLIHICVYIKTILLMKLSLKEAIAKEIGTLTLKAVAPTEQAWDAQGPYSLWHIVRDRFRELRLLPDRGCDQNCLFSGGFGRLSKTPRHLLKVARERSITPFADAGATPQKHRKGKTTVPSNAPDYLYREKQMSLFWCQLMSWIPLSRTLCNANLYMRMVSRSSQGTVIFPVNNNNYRIRLQRHTYIILSLDRTMRIYSKIVLHQILEGALDRAAPSDAANPRVSAGQQLAYVRMLDLDSDFFRLLGLVFVNIEFPVDGPDQDEAYKSLWGAESPPLEIQSPTTPYIDNTLPLKYDAWSLINHRASNPSPFGPSLVSSDVILLNIAVPTTREADRAKATIYLLFIVGNRGLKPCSAFKAQEYRYSKMFLNILALSPIMKLYHQIATPTIKHEVIGQQYLLLDTNQASPGPHRVISYVLLACECFVALGVLHGNVMYPRNAELLRKDLNQEVSVKAPTQNKLYIQSECAVIG